MRNVYAAAKWVIEVLFNINLLICRKPGKNRIILLLTPQYLNFGDHAIAAAERDILREIFPDRPLVEINYSFYCYWPERVKKIIQKDDLLLITGGGFMGSLWPELEDAVIDIVTSCKENRIVFAPQTVFFQNKDRKGLQCFKAALKEHGNFLLLAREKQTFDFLKKEMGLAPDVNCGLMPDMALFLHTKEPLKKKRHGIGLCLRNDCEQSLSMHDRNELNKIIAFWKEPVSSMEMARDHVEIPVRLRKWFLNRKLQEFASRKLVITDRLHGMVFAAVTGTPCIVFDNISRKISGVYQWISSLNYIIFVSGLKEFEEAAWTLKQMEDVSCVKNYTDLSDRLKADYIMPAGKKED